MSVTINQLTIGYSDSRKDIVVAESINLNLVNGELVCLMGPNGIGKSTLLRTLTGLQPPLSGDIFINGVDIQKSKASERAQQVAIVLTERPTAGFMTVRELVALGRYPYTNWQSYHSLEDEQAINQALNQVGLMARQHQAIAELSDGYLQKALIARALTQDTDLIVLDEPTVHLDIKNKTEVIQLLRSLSKTANKTILLSTHDLDLALSYADQLWLFNEEQILTGLPEDLVLSGDIIKTFGFYEADDVTMQTPLTKDIFLSGTGFAHDLAVKALKKAGIGLNEQSREHYTLKMNKGHPTWIHESSSASFESIEDLISHITRS